ncbi:MAG: hypothetical protein HOI74_14405 [Gammaproteobacteria bacterium]|nr:hypothetical protein [Gammaproteobacteria bacterium]MBT5725213.1 hypothetical protein [Gammaproteobacteria bacterium]
MTSSEPSDLITGSWRTTIGGFSIATTYTTTEVTVDGHEPLSYQLEGNQLTIDGDQTTSRLVGFPSSSVMIQVDVITGTEHRFERVASAG